MGESDGDGSNAPDFEKLLREAEELAERMEDGGLSLAQSLVAYEKGMRNLRSCAELLREAEARVKILTEKGGGFRLEDFAWDGDGAGEGSREDGDGGR
ncbi:MAG: exodeoxyribonuclease VII small subunit [Planctomycetota bacterium]|jgi:exodeoxyribonuclease VII small subunit|nr:exodeoxyribonuclease VII small subunit [Planctomycetota bacterium]